MQLDIAWHGQSIRGYNLSIRLSEVVFYDVGQVCFAVLVGKWFSWSNLSMDKYLKNLFVSPCLFFIVHEIL